MEKKVKLKNLFLGVSTAVVVMVGCSKDEIGQDEVNDVFDSKDWTCTNISNISILSK